MAISVGSVSVDVVPNASRFADQLRASIVPQAGTLGEEIGKQIADRIAASIRNGIQNGLQGGAASSQGAQAGNSYGDEFSRVVKTRIEAALRSLPTVQIGVATSEADQKLRDLTARLQSLQHQTIGVDVSGTEALAEIDKIKADLASLARDTPDVKVRVDALAAIAQLKVVREEIARLEAKPAEVRVVAKDEFSTIIRTKVEAAAASLPEIQIGVATSAAEQKLRDLHVRLEELRDKRVGVDIDAKDALAEVEKIKVKLDELAHKSPDIQVRVDAAKAVAELAAVKAEVDKLDRKHADVKVDSSAASAGISGLVAGIAAIGPALIPIAAVAAAGLGAVGTVAVAGAAGVGVLALALHGVSGAVTAVNAQQASAATDAKAYATAQASAAAAVQGAQASLANAVSSADNSSISSAQAVKTARTTLADAVSSADNSTISSAEAVQKAQTGLANAITTADNSAISSAQAVQTARTGLAKAIESADNSSISSAQAVKTAQTGLANAITTADNSSINSAQAVQTARTGVAKAIESADNSTISSAQAVQNAHTGVAKAITTADNFTISSAQAVETARTGLAKAIESADNSAISSAQAVQTARTALDNANTTADNAAISSAQAVQTARVGLANAIATANNAAISSAEAVGNAQQALDDTTRAAALSVTNALQAEDNAETALAQALQNEQVAQEALTAARKTAQQQIEDLTLSVQDGALSQRAANLAVETSKIALDKVLANPASSKLQREQAQLTYDQAVQHVKDLGVQQDRLHIKQAQAVQAGVDGSAVVVTAQDRIATSVRAVETAQDNVAKTAAAVAEAQRAGLEKIGNAQQHLADSQRAQDEKARTSAQSVAAAQQTLSNSIRAQGVQAETSAHAVEAAQQSVTNALRAQGVQARTSAESVTAAQLGITKALRAQEQQAVSSAASIAAAQQSLANAERAQSVQAKSSAESVAAAQQAVTNALRAQEQQAVSSAASVAAAQQTLSNATRAQEQQARTSAESVAAAQQGITNALRAQEVQAKSSAQSVTTAQQGVTDAIRAQGVQARTSAQSIEKAQEGITNALRAQEQQAVSSAASVAAAQRALENAQRAQKTAAEQVSSSAQAAQKALAALTPAGREFVAFITGTMQPALKKLQETAAAGLLPGLQSGLAALIPIMPTVNEAVGKLARAMGDLFSAAGKALDSPFYRKFITFIGDEGSKTLGTFGQIIGNLVTGFAGLLMAFAPFTDAIGDGLLKLSKKFADFGTNTDPNSPLQKFIAYVKEVGPTVIDTFKQLGTFVGHVVEALAPFGKYVLEAIDAVTRLLNKLSPTELLGAAAGVAGIAAVFAPGLGSIAFAIGLAVAAIVSLYDNNKTFKDYVDKELAPALGKFATNYNDVTTKIDQQNTTLDQNGKATDNSKQHLGDLVDFLTTKALPALGTVVGIFVETTKAALGGVATVFGQIGDFFVKFGESFGEANKQYAAAYNFTRDQFSQANDQIVGGFNFVKDQFSQANDQIKGGWDGLGRGYNFLKDQFSQANDQIAGAYNFLKDQFSQANNQIKDGWNFLSGGLNSLKGDFDSFVTGVGQIWDKMKELTAKPINFVINTILNDGLIKGFNAVTGLIGIPAVPNIPAIPGYAGGGALHGPGTGTSDEILMYGSNNEHMVTEREVQGAGGHAAVEAQRKVWAENYASGGPITMKQVIPQFADGGPVTWPAMLSIIQGQFPDAIDTSDYRPGPGYHGKSEALDIGFAGNDRGKLLEADKWIGSNYSNSTQLIHQGGVNIAFGQDKGDGVGYYGAQTMAEHDTHVHWANDRDPHLNSGNVFSSIANAIGGVAGSVVQSLRDTVGSAFDAIVSPIGSLIGSKFKAPPVVNGIPQSFFDTEKGKVRDFITGKADAKQSASSASGNYTGPIPGGDAVGRWRGLVDSTLAELDLNVGLDDKVLRQIATESGGDPNATQGNIGDVNNASGDLAKGLMQVIGSTFRAYSGPYTSLGQYDPHASIYAGLNYGKFTYGPDLSALGQGHGYDSGGWLKPGDVGLNFTGRPEAVLTPEESAGLKAGMNSGGAFGGRDVTINVHSQPGQSGEAIAGEVKRQLLFEMR